MENNCGYFESLGGSSTCKYETEYRMCPCIKFVAQENARNEIDISELTGDRLEIIFDLQKKLYNRFVDPEKELTQAEKIQKIKDHIIYMFDELSEVLRTTPFKGWKDYSNFEFAEHETAKELIDVLHFLVESFIILGYDSEDVFKMYALKNKENIIRNDIGY